MSTKDVEVNTMPIFQNQKLAKFLVAKNLNYPQSYIQPYNYKTISSERRSRYKLSEHSKRVLNELKYINKVVNQTQIDNNNNNLFVISDNNVHVNKRNKGVVYRNKFLNINKTDIKEDEEGELTKKARHSDMSYVNYPPVLLYKHNPLNNNNNNKHNNGNNKKHKVMFPVINNRQLNKIDITKTIPNVSKSIRDQEKYMYKLNIKYSNALPIPFK